MLVEVAPDRFFVLPYVGLPYVGRNGWIGIRLDRATASITVVIYG